MKLSKTICSLAIAAMAGFGGSANAQWKPSKPIEMIVHTAPGGGNDVLARAMVQMLEKENLLPVRMQVLNRPGGNGAVAAAAIAEKKATRTHWAWFRAPGSPTLSSPVRPR